LKGTGVEKKNAWANSLSASLEKKEAWSVASFASTKPFLLQLLSIIFYIFEAFCPHYFSPGYFTATTTASSSTDSM